MSRSDYDDMPTSFNRRSRRRGSGRKSYIFALMGVLIILIVVIVLMVFNGETGEEKEVKQEPSISVEVTEVEEVDVDVPSVPVITAPAGPDPVPEPEAEVPVTVPETEEEPVIEEAVPEEGPVTEITEEVPSEPVEEASGEVPAAEEEPAQGSAEETTEALDAEEAVTGTEETAVPEEEPVAEESVPVVEEAPQEKSPFTEYIVEEGDSLSFIANKFSLSLDTLASVNRIVNQSDIKAGKVMIIPPTDGILYPVQDGDTAESVMQRFHITDITAEEFVKLNGTDGKLEGAEWLFIPQAADEASTAFIRPTDGAVDMVFGETWKDEMLQGVTFILEPGDAVRAIADGLVVDLGLDGRYNERFITIMHDEFYKSTYYGLELMQVRLGQEVKQGDVIATVGTRSRYFGPSRLYFKLEQGPVKLDPLMFF